VGSEPIDVDNPDNTRSLIWEFDEPLDYVVSDAQVEGGKGSLLLHSGTVEEATKEAFDQGVRMDNISTEELPDSLVLDASNIDVHNLIIPQGPEMVDSYVSEADPGTNFGADVCLRANSQSGNRMNILMWFDISALPSDAIVHNATLWLYLVGGRTQELELKAYALTRGFEEEEVTWNRNSSSSTWDDPGGDYSDAAYSRLVIRNALGWYRIDLTRMVENWARGSVQNHGLILAPSVTSGDALKEFESSDDSGNPSQRPQLSIKYSQPGLVGTYESRAMGEGPNATFYSVSWSCQTVSLASDEFSGTSLSPRWTWLNDPFADEGAYDVGATRSGWLHVLGSPKRDLGNNNIDANFLYQNITGDFALETRVETFFEASTMGAGLLVAGDMLSWVAIYVTNITGTMFLVVKAGEGGLATVLSQTLWNYEHAYLKADRTGSTIVLRYSADGTSWTPAYTYAPSMPLVSRLMAGVCVLSGTANIGAVAEFDYCRMEPLGPQDTTVLCARTGNSTLLTDPSWTSWSEELTSGTVLGASARYVQYSVVMTCPYDWYSPAFSSFSCAYEHFSPSGVIETIDHTVMDFSRWCTLTMEDDVENGSIKYSWSTDHGVTWNANISSGSYSIYSTEPSIMLRIQLSTDDTARTPTVDRIEVSYLTALVSFHVAAPDQVVAGEPFFVTIYAKDESNATMPTWRGTVNLKAMDLAGENNATQELLVTEAYISSGGYVTVPDESYTCAETIRICAFAGGVSGLSDPVVVQPGPAQSVSIGPTAETLIEFTDYEFLATARDSYGNAVPGLTFAWSVDAALGTITVNGASIVLHTGMSGGEGTLMVTCNGFTASLDIRIVRESTPPEFLSEIPAQQVIEDSDPWRLDLSPYLFDAEDPSSELRWYVTNESLVTVEHGENVTGEMNITFGTVQDAFGTNVLKLFVVDSAGMWNSTEIVVEIAAVNDRPTIHYIAPLVVPYDQGYIYDFRYYVHDVDDPNENLRLSVDSESEAYATPNWLWITFNYPESLNGTVRYVVVTVIDSQGLNSSTVVQITVSDDLAPLTLPGKSLPDITMYQGDVELEVFDLDEYFTDPDGDTLTYSFLSDHVEVTINLNHTVDLRAPTDWHGEEYVVFKATDPAGARAEQAMGVTVLHINQPPSIGPVPDLGVRYDQRYNFDLRPYLADPDDAVDSLIISTNDSHIAVIGTVLSMYFPQSMDGYEMTPLVTVSDGELHATRAVNITISDNSPPVAEEMPDHMFPEDGPAIAYPEWDGLDHYFTDLEDPDGLSFYAFTSIDLVEASTSEEEGEWYVEFYPAPDYYGVSWLTIRATDPDGGIAERSIVLSVLPVPDAPVLALPTSLSVELGKQIAFDLSANMTDDDPEDEDFTFLVTSDVAGLGFAVLGSVLMLDFPEWFLDGHGRSRTTELTVRVTDPHGLTDTHVIAVTVYRPLGVDNDNTWLWATILLLSGTAFGFFMIALSMRKRPLTIRDMMVIHNDGFLMARYAAVQKGEVDEQILSGMLTAVLNFVEDSMDTTHDQLKTFGFRDMKVMVKRGHSVYAAIVYEGDVPGGMEEELASFLEKIERVYRRTIESWTGDLETDYAGMGMLIQGFVGEHSRKTNGEGAAFLRSNDLKGEESRTQAK